MAVYRGVRLYGKAILPDMSSESVSAADEAGGNGLGRVRIVLVETTHPGNIGAVARAMKTMGLSRLVLVNPKLFPSAEATARASGADDVLMASCVVPTLADAVADCVAVFGTTARPRYLEWPVLAPREAAARITTLAADGEVALVFGRERTGLTNAELELCSQAVRIPTNPEFSSLNIAQAAQILAYELRLCALGAAGGGAEEAGDPLATARELEALSEAFLEGMTAVDYFDPERPKLLPRRLRRLFNSAGLHHSEVQILRGFMTSLLKWVRGR